MVEVVSCLAHFEDPNSFQALQLKDEESIQDVESPEEIVNRLIRYASELAMRETTSDDCAYVAKKRSFEAGELDEGWTIVANRRPRRSGIPVQQTEEDTPSVMEEKPAKPKNWRRSIHATRLLSHHCCRGILALGAAAVVGLASFLVTRRSRRQH